MNKTKEINDFIKTWENAGDEVGDKATFWNKLLEIIGVPKEEIDNNTYINYEKKIKLRENENFFGQMDGYIPSTKVIIEQKSNGIDLFKAEDRPNGLHHEKITPFQQGMRYNNHLSAKEKAYYIVLCNFKQFAIYDIRESLDVKPIIVDLKDLKENLYLFSFLVNKDESQQIKKEQQISVAAGDLVSKIYNELSNIFANYTQLDDAKVKHSINSLCVRLVFCLYAEDAGLFDTKEAFYNYLKDVAPNEMGLKLKALFKVLNTKIEDRTKHDAFWNAEHPDLKDFPYVNGGLFANEDIFIPPFTKQLKDIILNDASRGFDWSAISPTVFGAVFESTLNPETRRSGGMHYTSVENIHKVIDPLFLNDLKQELEDIKKYKNKATIKAKALIFQDKLSKLTFFDPACGSGNFLTETFLSLRRLENEAIRLETNGESLLDVGQSSDWIKVSIKQFYGIEINDFAVSVAKTAMWIAEDQLQKETQDLLYAPGWDFLPLKTYVNIKEGDALKMDWNDVLANYVCHYVFGNPPFVGYDWMTPNQKDDMKLFFKKTGRLDFVVAWYMKAAQYAEDKPIQFAFVSTNSITQGIQVPSFFPQLISKGFKINFAYRTFVWNNEAKNKARVHCVIIGFSFNNYWHNKLLFDEMGKPKIVKNISPYLTEGNEVIVQSSFRPLNKNVPRLLLGNMPKDGGGFIFDTTEYNEIKRNDPIALKYARRYMMGREFINNIPRYCYWLVNANPADIRKSPHLRSHVEQVKEYREKSKAISTQKLADTPTLFAQIIPMGQRFIAIPKVSSQRRKYIPIGFISDKVIPGDKLFVIPNANLYEFGILTSIVHMAWTKIVAGRLKSDYSYTSTVVYNTFPWPTPTPEQRKKIEETAQGILDARAKYPDSSLADLYDPLTMPVNLFKAHQINDRAVLQAYILPTNVNESDIVAHLFKMYEALTK